MNTISISRDDGRIIDCATVAGVPPIYTVTGDADELDGWDSSQLAAALEQEFGGDLRIELRASQYGGGGLTRDVDDGALRAAVESRVSAVIERGPQS